MSRRTEQVARLLAHVVSEIVPSELSDPNIKGLITITGAKISIDLRNAIIYFSILGDEVDWESTQKALNHASGFIQQIVGERIILKVTPKLKFVPDHTIENAQKIEELIDEFTTEQEKLNDELNSDIA